MDPYTVSISVLTRALVDPEKNDPDPDPNF